MSQGNKMADEPAQQRQADDETSYFAPLVGFRTRKAAQLSAFFASKCEQGAAIDKLKLIKLIYMAERRFLIEHHFPMLFDELYSLPHGPICSSTLNGIDGVIHRDVWDKFITRHGKDHVFPTQRFDRNDLDDLSDAELVIAEKIWARFGRMGTMELRKYTHDHCPEYTETTGRIPISYREILEAVDDPDAESVDREIAGMRRAEGALLG
jgi:uncharacterized phage-associated protein